MSQSPDKESTMAEESQPLQQTPSKDVAETHLTDSPPPPPPPPVVPAMEKKPTKLHPSLVPPPDSKPVHLGHVNYHPARLLPSLTSQPCFSLLTIRVPARYLSYTNPSVQERKLWGTDIYTDDSDPVAAAIHSGMYVPKDGHPCDWPTTVSTEDADLVQQCRAPPLRTLPDHDACMTLMVLPTLEKYTGTVRHFMRSRDWGVGEGPQQPHHGASFRIVSCDRVPRTRHICERGRRQHKQSLLQAKTAGSPSPAILLRFDRHHGTQPTIIQAPHQFIKRIKHT